MSTSTSKVDFGGYALDNLGAFLNDLDLGGKKVTNLGAPTSDSDVATK